MVHKLFDIVFFTKLEADGPDIVDAEGQSAGVRINGLVQMVIIEHLHQTVKIGLLPNSVPHFIGSNARGVNGERKLNDAVVWEQTTVRLSCIGSGLRILKSFLAVSL